MDESKIESDPGDSSILPDLTVENCPLSCNRICDQVWINTVLGHKIICNCTCHKIKNNAADGFLEPKSATSQLSSEVTNDYDQ